MSWGIKIKIRITIKMGFKIKTPLAPKKICYNIPCVSPAVPYACHAFRQLIDFIGMEDPQLNFVFSDDLKPGVREQSGETVVWH
jgi:hypothetical protein